MKIKSTTQRILISLAILFIATPLFSQQITGKIIDSSTKDPPPCVDVITRRRSDSTVIVGTDTHDDGSVTVANSNEEHYLWVNFMGYPNKDIQQHLSDLTL